MEPEHDQIRVIVDAVSQKHQSIEVTLDETRGRLDEHSCLLRSSHEMFRFDNC